MIPATDDTANLNGNAHDKATLAAAVAAITIGLAALGLQPIIVGALVEYSGVGQKMVGYVASAEVFGIAVANALSIVLGRKCNWAKLYISGLLLLIIGNISSITIGGSASSLLLCRLVAGFGAGIVLSRGYAIAKYTKSPSKTYSYALAGSTAHTTLAILYVPKLNALAGPSASFVYLAVLGCIGFVFLSGMMHSHPSVEETASESSSISNRVERFFALSAAASLFLGLGALWAYLVLIGTSAGVDLRDVTFGLMISQIAAFTGALLPAVLEGRIRQSTLLALALIGTIASVSMLGNSMSWLTFTVAVSGFNGISNVAMPLAISKVAAVDTDGRLISSVVTLQTAGFAFGPALAALVISGSTFEGPKFLSMGLLLISLAFSIGLPLIGGSVRERRTYA